VSGYSGGIYSNLDTLPPNFIAKGKIRSKSPPDGEKNGISGPLKVECHYFYISYKFDFFNSLK